MLFHSAGYSALEKALEYRKITKGNYYDNARNLS